MEMERDIELAVQNGRYGEIGSSGMQVSWGYIEQAYNPELYWPTCYELFNRIRRSDPEVTLARQVFGTFARDTKFSWQLPDKPSDDDKRAQEFAESVFEDMMGGSRKFIDTLIAHVPFLGWGWWEVVPAVRSPGWVPPAPDQEWRSKYKDGRIGIRKLAWRDHSAFTKWDIDELTGDVHGMVQTDYPNPEITIPLERSLHITFGDANSPEGLSPLEAVWRLERIKYKLEIIQGIGYDHSAGHAEFKSEQTLTEEDKINIKRAARSLMTAQEGNYMALPGHITAQIIDTSFASAPAILEAIRYYGILKLQVFNVQWMSLAATAGVGSNAAMDTSAAMAIMSFNGMLQGFADQMSDQLGRWLFRRMNPGAFPGMTALPTLTADPVEKSIGLGELGSLVQTLFPLIDIGEDDVIAVRRKTGFLPEALPEKDVLKAGGGGEEKRPDAAVPVSNDEEPEEEEAGDTADDDEDEKDGAEFERKVIVEADERPTVTTEADIEGIADVREIARIRRLLKKLADEDGLSLDLFFDAPIVEEDEDAGQTPSAET